MRRVIASLALASLIACGTGSGVEKVEAKDLDGIAETSSLAAREFSVTITEDSLVFQLSGLVEDTYRYAATVNLHGKPLFQEVVSDDARYVRVLDPEAFATKSGAAAAPGARALLSGDWVVDPRGAPPEFSAADAEAADPLADLIEGVSPALLGARTVLNEIRFLDAIPQLLRVATSPRAWNPDGANYLPKDDKFPPYTEDGTRFDSIPRAFDPGSNINSIQSLHPFFQYTSVWTRDGFISRVEKLFEPPHRADPQYRAMFEGLGRQAVSPDKMPPAQRGQAILLARFLQGGNNRTEERLYNPPPGEARITIPRNAVSVDLAAAITALQNAITATIASFPGVTP